MTELERRFAIYIAQTGYKPLLVWSNERGLYAQIKGYVHKPSKYFSQVLSGGTIVRLSYLDLENKMIVGDFKFKD